MATKKSASTSSKKSTKKASASPKKATKTPSASSAASKPSSKKAPAKSAATKATDKTTTAKKASLKTTAKTTGKTTGTKSDAAPNKASETAKADPSNGHAELPKPRFSKDGLGYTKDFPLPFIKQCYDDLQAERIRLTGQANRLEHEAQQLVEDSEMGDVQFDDEGGEGDTLAVERERDLTLSAQARETVREIDDALARIAKGTYGYSVQSGRPIPTERLEAIPWSTVLVEEKVGGLGRR